MGVSVSDQDDVWMKQAIQLAKCAAKQNEVPVGAILLLDNQVIGQGWNQPISQCDPSAHAEIIALRDGAKQIQNYRLLNTTLYVTLEPCMMCMGAMVQARIKRLVFGAYDVRFGGVGSTDKVNHHVEYKGGVLKDECALLLSEFFQARRQRMT